MQETNVKWYCEAPLALSTWVLRTLLLFWLLSAIPPVQENMNGHVNIRGSLVNAWAGQTSRSLPSDLQHQEVTSRIPLPEGSKKEGILHGDSKLEKEDSLKSPREYKDSFAEDSLVQGDPETYEDHTEVLQQNHYIRFHGNPNKDLHLEGNSEPEHGSFGSVLQQQTDTQQNINENGEFEGHKALPGSPQYHIYSRKPEDEEYISKQKRKKLSLKVYEIQKNERSDFNKLQQKSNNRKQKSNRIKPNVRKMNEVMEDFDKGYYNETIVENDERIVIRLVKRDTTKLDSQGKSTSQRQSYAEILHDTLTTKKVRHRRHKMEQLAANYDYEMENSIPNNIHKENNQGFHRPYDNRHHDIDLHWQNYGNYDDYYYYYDTEFGNTLHPGQGAQSWQDYYAYGDNYHDVDYNDQFDYADYTGAEEQSSVSMRTNPLNENSKLYQPREEEPEFFHEATHEPPTVYPEQVEKPKFYHKPDKKAQLHQKPTHKIQEYDKPTKTTQVHYTRTGEPQIPNELIEEPQIYAKPVDESQIHPTEMKESQVHNKPIEEPEEDDYEDEKEYEERHSYVKQVEDLQENQEPDSQRERNGGANVDNELAGSQVVFNKLPKEKDIYREPVEKILETDKLPDNEKSVVLDRSSVKFNLPYGKAVDKIASYWRSRDDQTKYQNFRSPNSYSSNPRFDVATYLKKMSFKGYEKKTDKKEEPNENFNFEKEFQLQSDTNDISNDLTVHLESSPSRKQSLITTDNHIEKPESVSTFTPLTQIEESIIDTGKPTRTPPIDDVVRDPDTVPNPVTITYDKDPTIPTTVASLDEISTTTVPEPVPNLSSKYTTTEVPEITTTESYPTTSSPGNITVIPQGTTSLPPLRKIPTLTYNRRYLITTTTKSGKVIIDGDSVKDKNATDETEDDPHPAFIPAKLPFGPFIPNPENVRPETSDHPHHFIDLMPKIKPFFLPYDTTTIRAKPGNLLTNVLSPIFGSEHPRSAHKGHKNLLEYDSERSQNEELYNKVSGSPMPTFGKESTDRAPPEITFPYIPSVRQQKYRMFTNSRLHGGFAFIDRKHEEGSPLSGQKFEGSEDSPRDQNLIVFGHVKNDTIMDTLRNCTTYVPLDLISHYSIADLIRNSSSNPLRQLIVYLNLKSVSYEGYDIVLERIKSILDHLSHNHGGLSVFSVIPNIADEIDTKSKEVKTQLVNLNDAILDFCARSYPICYGTFSLAGTLESLKRTYHKDSGFDVYDVGGSSHRQCASNEVCGTASPTTVPDVALAQDPEEQLILLTDAVCRSSYHLMLELVANIPTYDFKDYARQFDNVREESIRVRAQTGLALHDILPRDLKQYDKNRPPKYEGHATIVYFHVTVLSVDSIDEESMTYVADIFLAQSWRDHRLRLPENMTEEYRILDVEWLHNIWRPDCFFKNAKKVTFHEMSVPNHYLWLYHDKTLLYMAKLTLVLSCAMKFEAYPHDTQICSMMIESLSHTTHDLVFKWNETDPLVVNPDIELPQLDISRNNTEDCTLTYSTGNFTCLAVVFNLRRRLGYHLFHTYVPSAITVVMSWISFWIKPEAIPARVTLGVTSLLTLATQNQQSQSALPPVSYLKAIDVWMSSCTVFVFASLLQFGIVTYFMDAEPLSKDMTGYSVEDLNEIDEKKSDDGHLNGYSRSRSRSRSRARTHSPAAPMYIVHRCTGKDIAIYIDKFSRAFFPFAFFILNVSYWTTYGTM